MTGLFRRAVLPADLLRTTTPDGASIVGFLPNFVSAVGRLLRLKLSEWVNLSDFGVVGDGVTDDTVKFLAALNSGAKYVCGLAGKTYLVSYTGTKTVLGVQQRYCVAVPPAITLDMQFATIKAANASNASVFINANAGTSQDADFSIINGVIDCNRAGQTAPATGEMAGWYFYDTLRMRLQNLRVDNARQYAGRVLKADYPIARDLLCTGSDGDGFGWGIGASAQHVRYGDFDNIKAIACTGAYGGGLQGNPMIFTARYTNIGKVYAESCGGGLKIQDDSADVNIDEVIFKGFTNGSVNSGFKVQGNGGGLQPNRINVGSVSVSGAYGNGLYVNDAMSVNIGRYHGISNGTGAAATGSDKHDVNIEVPTGGRVLVGSMNSETPGAQCGRVQGTGYCKIDVFVGKNPTGIGVTYNGTGECYIDDLKVNDSAAGMTFAFRTTGGKGRVGRLTTDKAHSTTQSRAAIDAGLYDWSIGEIRLGSADVLGGVVTLTNAATATAVTCGHIWKDYVGGVADNLMPIIKVSPFNPSARALGVMYAVPVAGSVGTGMSIKHAAAGATDFVRWGVEEWRVMARDVT